MCGYRREDEMEFPMKAAAAAAAAPGEELELPVT